MVGGIDPSFYADKLSRQAVFIQGGYAELDFLGGIQPLDFSQVIFFPEFGLVGMQSDPGDILFQLFPEFFQ
jgi:hypothetical protein